uniref:peptidylprolyl isomerase n=1 Tax=Zooxanthella nutricula TaxID=1333877 RepID=A0A6V0DCM3_9DINO|mmetsp:Transcript_1013/g.3009  ORF Transcript_1013/g.3009 Transcript_1013/m.3009 type:complete len:175 (+) Transcript_1013:72-596(+)
MAEEFTVQMKVEVRAGKEETVTLKVHPEWAPKGAQRFKDLVSQGYYDQARWHRVIKDFIAQVGIAADPTTYKDVGMKTIEDDAVKVKNKKGTVSFAKRNEPCTRSCQIFVNLVDNFDLDKHGFAPFAEVVEGFSTIESLQVLEVDQARLKDEGNAYLDKDFPGKLSEIKEAKIV